MRLSSRGAIFAALCFLSAIVLYSPGLSGPILFDDRVALTANPLVKIDGSVFDEWRTAALSSRSGLFRRPISMFSFTVNYVAAGDFGTVGLKAVNLTIHLLVSVLLYFFFRSVLHALGVGKDDSLRGLLAITAAAIWLLHPLHVSTVLYAVQRMAQLSALFVLAGMLVFTHYRQRWAEQDATGGELIAAALWLLFFTVMAVLSKENGALLPWLIVVLEVAVFRGVWAGAKSPRLVFAGWLALFLPLLAILLILALSPDSLIGGYVRREFTLEERLLTQARLLWRYLGWIVLPNIRDMGFQHDDIPLSTTLFNPLTTIFSLLAWPLSLFLAFRYRHRYPLVFAALLCFLVGHSMESSVIPLEMAYEHRNYLPSTLICLLIAAFLVIPASRAAKVSVWYPVLGALVLLCALLFVRVQTWSDEMTLSRVNVVNHPESSRSNYFYANALLRKYRRREQFELTEQEAGETLLLSRHYFERMYQTNERDVAALVMLTYLDSQFFPELRERVDWFQILDDLLTTRTLYPSDWNALDMLVNCLASDSCTESEDRVIALLDKLSQRYPRSVNVTQYRHLYLSSLPGDSYELMPLLQEAQQKAPGTPGVYYPLLTEYARLGDVASMYDYARIWLARDRQRYSLPLLKALFVEDSAVVSPLND